MKTNPSLLGKKIGLISLPILFYPLVSHAAETTITINTDTQRFIGEISVLDRDKFFNLHSTPTSSQYDLDDLRVITEELNAGFGRSFWSPMSAAGDTLYPSTDFALENGPLAIQQQHSNPLYPFTDRRVVVTDHPINVMKEGNNPVEGARWAADYFENYYDDTTRPLFYEPLNEPFVHASDFVDGPWDPVQNAIVQDQMTEWFKEIGLEFDRRGIDTKIIGYSSAWPSLELNDFGYWYDREKRFMDIAGEAVDAFSFHLYDGVNVKGQDNKRSGSNAEAIMDLIETYSHYKWDKIKPHALTEYGGIIDGFEGVDYSPERSSQELPSLNHLLFSALAREDRLLTSIPFITGKATWFYQANNFQPYSAAVWRPDPDKIYGSKVNGFLLTEKAKFFHLWSEVKGSRIDIQEQDPDLYTQAFVYGKQVFVALNNLEDEAKTVALNFVSSLDNLQSVRIKRLNVPYGEAAMYVDETTDIAPNELTLAAHETVVLEYQFSAPVKQHNIVRKQSYYAYEHLQPIVANQALNFNINQVSLTKDPLSFTDYIVDQFDYDENLAKSVKPQLHNALTALITKLNRSFAMIVSRYPDTWQQHKQLAVLVKNAKHNRNMNLALQHHFYTQGFNTSQGTALLRMSIGRKHDKSKQPNITVNGHAVSVPNDWAGYDQATRTDFFGAIEIPVPNRYLKTDNLITTTFSDSDGRVSSLVLEVDTQEAMVNVPVTGIEVSTTTLQMNKDKMRRLHASVLPKNASDQYVIWQSSNPEIVSVDSNGVLTPIQPGNATISVMANDNNDQFSTIDVEVLDQITLPNTITIIEDTSDEVSSTNYVIKLAYSTNIDRDISLEMRSPTNQWLGEKRITVPAGEGETEINFTLNEPLPAGTGYTWTAGLREINGDWRTNVDSHKLSGIVIHPEDWVYTDESSVEITSGFENLALSPSYKVTVQYSAVLESDVTVDLFHTSGWKAGTRTTVQPGTGEVELTLWPATPLAADSGYRLISAIREVGGNWQTDFANTVIDDITISDGNDDPVIDSNLISDLNANFETGNFSPWDTAWDSVGTAEVNNSAALDSNFGLAIDTTAGKVGIVLSSNALPQDIYQINKRLKISFDAKRASSGGWVGGFAQFWNNAGAWVASEQKWFEIKPTWTRVEFEIDGQDFTSGSTNFQININKAGEHIFLDNFKIEDVTP